ncbi:hypothetical protein [Vreelandella alkaliphila]|uniref:hypothetical protein n=1 Tax=Vreelandella alkaliphila TaxID=272774 RepID=UPI003F97F002
MPTMMKAAFFVEPGRIEIDDKPNGPFISVAADEKLANDHSDMMRAVSNSEFFGFKG